MLPVGIIGVNHKSASLSLREALAKAFETLFRRESLFPVVLINTCNRTEIYFSTHDLAATHVCILQMLRKEVGDEFEHALYSFFSEECFLHLARVTAGLDSAIVGETEIQGQVRREYELASQHYILPPEIHFIFQKSLKAGKKVRTEVLSNQCQVQLEHAIYALGQENLLSPMDARVLFIGASEINAKVLNYFHGRGMSNLTLCNRSRGNAEVLTEGLDVALIDWHHYASWGEYDWVIVGTKYPGYLLTPTEERKEETLLMDLSVPRNIDPALGCGEKRDVLYNIEQINDVINTRREDVSRAAHDADRVIQENVDRQAAIYIQKAAEKERLRTEWLAAGATG